MDLNSIIALQKSRMRLHSDGSSFQNNGVFDNFERNPSYREVEYRNSTIGVHVIDDGIRSNVAYRKVIAQPPIQLQTGDYISITNNDAWLCVNEDDLLYNKTTFALCNKTLKWINKNGILIEKPAITTSQTLYTTGIKEEKLIQVPDGMTGVLFPYDDDTKALERDMSFIFNKTKYTITHYNEADRPGLLALICEESIPDGDYDDLENEIADRWDKDRNDRLDSKGEDPGNGELSIVIGGADSIFITDKATYTAKVYNNDVEVDEPVTFTLSNTSLAKIESQGNNQCVVKANDNFNAGRVTLTATLVSDEAVFTEKEIRIVGM